MSTTSGRQGIVWIGLVAVLANSLCPPVLPAGGWPGWPGTTRNLTTVERLAQQIDRVEKHIDHYGSVVPKAPDVWGEARLTKYRREYETQMAAQLAEFQATINAAISRSDQAFLASALSLQAAVSGDRAVATTPASRSESEASTVIAIPDGVDVEKAISGFDTVIKRSAKASEQVIGFGDVGKKGIALEPTIHLDQMSRYINHLHQLRRISDGDDKADAPGYALHLVRMPISVLPGDKTREGYGAEVTVMAKPHLHESLLPETFRGLVINDLVDQMTFPLAKFLDSEFREELLSQLDVYLALVALNGFVEGAMQLTVDDSRGWDVLRTKLAKFKDRMRRRLSDSETKTMMLEVVDMVMAAADLAAVNRVLVVNDETAVPYKSQLADRLKSDLPDLDKRIQDTLGTRNRPFESFTPGSMSLADALDGFATGSDPATQDLKSRTSAAYSTALSVIQQRTGPVLPTRTVVPAEAAREQQTPLNAQRIEIEKRFNQFWAEFEVSVPVSSLAPTRKKRFPFPPFHLREVYGDVGFLLVAQLANGLKHDPLNIQHTLLLDLQKVLAEEFHAAYDCLNRNPQSWEHCQTALHNAIRSDDTDQVEILRNAFLDSLIPSEVKYSHTGAMAWMIVVESALLNEQLKEDVRLLAAAKNAFCLNVDTLDWMNFFGPNPSPDARMLFNEYVRYRWPIHVVAVDPITQDQNVADSFSQRREMQLALALGFASGRVGADSFTRMARRLELDMETIALNRTVVGFSHGSDTFGWRFYPRVQSPDTGGHLQTFAVDMFKGISRDHELRERRLEPGTREVTAIVIMPSFVPYVIFDTRTNWFKLTHPDKREFTLQDTVAVSGEIMQMRRLSTACAKDAHLYRQDEVYRLTRAVEQLERRLPLQTTYAQMPFENSLGGFEFFNTGTADLAPELHGFYGEPGIRVKSTPTTRKTTIFLVGNHFSVHETKVIAGNQAICDDDMTLISRQVMQVSVPETATVIDDGKGGKFVDVHVATPYGVSNHILVPVIPDGATNPPAPAPAPAPVDLAAHVAERHFESYAWTGNEIGANLLINDLGETEEFQFSQEFPDVKYNGSMPTGFGPTRADVACHVAIKYRGAPKAKTRFVRHVESGDFSKNIAPLGKEHADQIAGAVEELIEEYRVNSGLLPQDVVSIELVGVLRVHHGGTKSQEVGLPVVQMDGDPLEVKIAIIEHKDEHAAIIPDNAEERLFGRRASAPRDQHGLPPMKAVKWTPAANSANVSPDVPPNEDRVLRPESARPSWLTGSTPPLTFPRLTRPGDAEGTEHRAVR